MAACRRWYLLADPKRQIPNIAEQGDEFVQTIVGVCEQEHFVLCSSLADESGVFMV
jgi:hypothetical protein